MPHTIAAVRRSIKSTLDRSIVLKVRKACTKASFYCMLSVPKTISSLIQHTKHRLEIYLRFRNASWPKLASKPQVPEPSLRSGRHDVPARLSIAEDFPVISNPCLQRRRDVQSDFQRHQGL